MTLASRIEGAIMGLNSIDVSTDSDALILAESIREVRSIFASLEAESSSQHTASIAKVREAVEAMKAEATASAKAITETEPIESAKAFRQGLIFGAADAYLKVLLLPELATLATPQVQSKEGPDK